MKLSTLATLTIGVTAGYLGARALMDRDTLPDELPEPLRERLERARARLLRARGEAMGALEEMERVRHAARQELTDDYLRRVCRDTTEAQRSGED